MDIKRLPNNTKESKKAFKAKDNKIVPCVISGQRGFSLVELMVAMTLGVMIVTASSMAYMNVEKVKRENRDLVSLQQEARIGINKIAGDVREAGMFGCANLGMLSTNGLSSESGAKPLVVWQKGADSPEWVLSLFDTKNKSPLSIDAADPKNLGRYGVAFLAKEDVEKMLYKGYSTGSFKILSDGLVVQRGRGAAKYVAPSVAGSDGTGNGDVFMFSLKDDAFMAVSKSEQGVPGVAYYNGQTVWALSDCSRIELFSNYVNNDINKNNYNNRKVLSEGALAGKLVFEGKTIDSKDNAKLSEAQKLHPFVDQYSEGLTSNNVFIKTEATLSSFSSNLYVLAEFKREGIPSGYPGTIGLWRLDLLGQDPSELIIPNAEELSWKFVFADDCKADDKYTKPPTYKVVVNKKPEGTYDKMIPMGVYMSFKIKGDEKGVPITASEVKEGKGSLREASFSNIYMGVRGGNVCANRTKT